MSPSAKPVVIPVNNERLFATYHGKEGQPALLFLHGYQSSKNDRFRFSYDLAEKLSEHGVSSLRIDFRGCGDSDGEMNFENHLEDGITSLEWLAKEHRPLAIIGRSLGGAIAVKLAAHFPVHSLILISPVFDLHHWNVPFSVEHELKQLQNLSILQFHAEKDEVLHKEHLAAYKRCASPNHRIEVVPHADHTYSDKETRKNLGLETFEWVINSFYGNASAKRETQVET